MVIAWSTNLTLRMDNDRRSCLYTTSPAKERPVLPPEIQALADAERRAFQERARAAAAAKAGATGPQENVANANDDRKGG